MPDLADFTVTVQQLLRARSQLNTRFKRRGTVSTTRSFAIQGLYLIGVRAFEAYLEDRIFDFASGVAQWPSRSVAGQALALRLRLQENRPEMLREIVLRGRSYGSFLPYKNTIDLARFLFVDGVPFSAVPLADRDILLRCSRVKNFIAHNSASARADFNTEAGKIPAFRRTPRRIIDYLDLGMRASVTYFDHDLSTLVRVANFLN